MLKKQVHYLVTTKLVKDGGTIFEMNNIRIIKVPFVSASVRVENDGLRRRPKKMGAVLVVKCCSDPCASYENAIASVCIGYDVPHVDDVSTGALGHANHVLMLVTNFVCL